VTIPDPVPNIFEAIKTMSKLENLSLNFKVKLPNIPFIPNFEWVSNYLQTLELFKVNFYDNKSGARLESFSSLASLKMLSLDDCLVERKVLFTLSMLTQLQELRLERIAFVSEPNQTEQLISFDFLSSLKNLESLSLRRFFNLKDYEDLSVLSLLTNLKNLEIKGSSIFSLIPLESLKLRSLILIHNIVADGKLREIIENIPTLKKVNVKDNQDSAKNYIR
jgi:hypothetical protein